MDLRVLASYWNIGSTFPSKSNISGNDRKANKKGIVNPAVNPMKPEQLLQVLASKAATVGPRGESLAKKLIHSTPGSSDFWTSGPQIIQQTAVAQPTANDIILSFSQPSQANTKKTFTFPRNYYGLPPIANPSTSGPLLSLTDCHSWSWLISLSL